MWTDPETWTWQKVEPDSNGDRTNIYIVWLTQALLLNLNESPFYANYGIPAQLSVIQRVFPDYYIARMQQLFSPFFASLIISKRATATPTYDVKVVTKQGAKLTIVAGTGNDRFQGP